MTFQEAATLHRQGRIDDAARAYEQILLADPTHLETLIYLGSLRLAQGDAVAAETLLRQAVTLAPGSPEALANLAAALQALDRHQDAIDAYEQALLLRPGMTDARFAMAGCLQAIGRDQDAIVAYEAILAADPAHPEANFGIATALTRSGRTQDAAASYRAALAADPDFAEASLGLARLLIHDNNAAEAIDHLRQALDVDPDYTDARFELGKALSSLGRDQDALTEFRAVVAADPSHLEAQKSIGTVLGILRRHQDAAEHYRALLDAHPDDPDAMGGLATAFKNLGEPDAALQWVEKTISARPDHAPAIGLLAAIQAETGSIKDAQENFRRAIALAPNRPDYLYHLVQLARVRDGDPVIPQLEALLTRIDSYPFDHQCELLFALAKAYDDIGQKDRGFDYLLRGNALKRTRTPYNEPLILRTMQRIAAVFTSDLLAARAGQGDPSTVPVFIVGMPRSGTTLVEQVLASHPAVFGAGERSELGDVIFRMGTQRLGAAPFPEAIWTLEPDVLRRMGSDYVAALRPLAVEALRIVDKMPVNFGFAGLIRLILPNAKIIHTVRDPVDTCLSIFSKLFSGDQPFSYDLAELGRYYSGYRNLMAHFRTVLPADSFIEVQYETMVDDFEAQARRIIHHCGLPWDPACLEFYKTARPVRTASMTQVRQPIYQSSVGRWRPDPMLLRPLLEGLGQFSVSGAEARK
jgi:tetratricopeptide (TPR) repeat protein